jgi:peptide/nickel transport system permease protein
MALYTARRIGLAIAIVCCAMAILFGMIYLIPGDPATIALGPLATPEMIAGFRAQMGLDQPIPVQFWNFVNHVFRGNLGVDVWSERPVRRIIAEVLPHTLVLTATGLGWAVLVGIPLGCYSARYRNSLADQLTGVLSVGVIAVPSFVVALLLLLIFAVSLRWFPAIGAGEPGHWGDQLSHLVLPSVAIGLGWVGYLARLVRASMLEVLGERHIRTLRAFGIPESRVVFRYALRLAILPTIALLGIGVGRLLSGAVFAEIVFARPGIGKLIYEAVLARNYPIVMGAALVTTGLFVVCTLAADLVAAWCDPRVRQSL